jgi:hypothetical protein
VLGCGVTGTEDRGIGVTSQAAYFGRGDQLRLLAPGAARGHRVAQVTREVEQLVPGPSDA